MLSRSVSEREETPTGCRPLLRDVRLSQDGTKGVFKSDSEIILF